MCLLLILQVRLFYDLLPVLFQFFDVSRAHIRRHLLLTFETHIHILFRTTCASHQIGQAFRSLHIFRIAYVDGGSLRVGQGIVHLGSSRDWNNSHA
jgi:hypothetical protein